MGNNVFSIAALPIITTMPYPESVTFRFKTSSNVSELDIKKAWAKHVLGFTFRSPGGYSLNGHFLGLRDWGLNLAGNTYEAILNTLSLRFSLPQDIGSTQAVVISIPPTITGEKLDYLIVIRHSGLLLYPQCLEHSPLLQSSNSFISELEFKEYPQIFGSIPVIVSIYAIHFNFTSGGDQWLSDTKKKLKIENEILPYQNNAYIAGLLLADNNIVPLNHDPIKAPKNKDRNANLRSRTSFDSESIFNLNESIDHLGVKITLPAGYRAFKTDDDLILLLNQDGKIKLLDQLLATEQHGAIIANFLEEQADLLNRIAGQYQIIAREREALKGTSPPEPFYKRQKR